MENPALYRLMFGPELTASKGAERPPKMQVAGNEAKAILAQIIREGARSGDFAMSVEDERHVAIATFIAWSAVHGLTMLIIDNLTGKNVPVQRAIELAIQTQLDGLRHGIGAIS